MSLYVEDMKFKLFLKTNDLHAAKIWTQKSKKKRFIKLFTNVQYTSPWLHGTHRNGIHFLPISNKYIGIMVFKASVIRVFRASTDIGSVRTETKTFA